MNEFVAGQSVYVLIPFGMVPAGIWYGIMQDQDGVLAPTINDRGAPSEYVGKPLAHISQPGSGTVRAIAMNDTDSVVAFARELLQDLRDTHIAKQTLWQTIRVLGGKA